MPAEAAVQASVVQQWYHSLPGMVASSVSGGALMDFTAWRNAVGLFTSSNLSNMFWGAGWQQRRVEQPHSRQ